MRDQAVRQLDDLVARRSAQAEAPAGHRQPERGAEAPRVEGRTGAHHGVLPPTEAPERIGHELELRRQLGVVREGGEVAPAAAVGDVGAAGRDAVGRRLDDPHHRAPVGTVASADLHLDQLAGQGVVDQHDPPVVPPGQGRPAGDQAFGPHELGLVVGAAVPTGGRTGIRAGPRHSEGA